MAISRDFAYGIPKAELHLHLEGTLEPDLKLKLAKKNEIDIGQETVDEVEASYQFDSLTSFLAVCYPAMNVLQDEDDFYALGSAYFARAKENGVVRAECFFDPQAHTSRGVELEAVIRGYYRAVEEARENGLRVTMHCDIDQVGSIDNIRTALTKLGAERLDHGTNIIEDPELAKLVVEKGIGLTSCPMSNSFVTEEMKGKEIVELLGRGVKVSINSDDPAYFGGYIADNFLTLAEKENLTKEQVAQLARNSIEISWAEESERSAMLDSLEEFLAAH